MSHDSRGSRSKRPKLNSGMEGRATASSSAEEASSIELLPFSLECVAHSKFDVIVMKFDHNLYPGVNVGDHIKQLLNTHGITTDASKLTSEFGNLWSSCYVTALGGIYLYGAFQDGLKHLLQEVDGSHDAIVVHGVPNVGKSTLSKMLAYIICLTHGECYLVKQIDTSHIRQSAQEEIYQYFFTQIPFLVLDQVNVHDVILDPQISERRRLKSKNGLYPAVLFTSGHFPPENAEAVRLESVYYRAIHLGMTEGEAKYLSLGISSDLLKECMQYSCMFYRLKQLADVKVPTNIDACLAAMFPEGQLSVNSFLNHESCRELVRHEFQKMLSCPGLPDEIEEYVLKNTTMASLAEVFYGFVKPDKNNTAYNSVFHLLELHKIGVKVKDLDIGFNAYKLDEYQYYFPDHKMFKTFLTGERNSNTEALYRRARARFEESMGATANRDLKTTGQEFEKMVRAYVDYVGFGLNVSSGGCNINVDNDCKVGDSRSSVDEVCSMDADDGTTYVTIEGGVGFDAACITFKERKCTKLNLYQMTVNPVGRSGEKKVRMQEKIVAAKRRLGLPKADKTTVVPYYIVPQQCACLSSSYKIPNPHSGGEQYLDVAVLKLNV